jgi:hypothetical protein
MANGNFDFRLPDGRIIRVEGAPSEEAAYAYMDTQWDRLRREMPIEGFGESFGQQFRGQFGAVPGALQAGAAAVGAPESITAGLGAAREFVAPGDSRPGTRAPELGDIVRNPIDALSAFAGQAAGAVAGGIATIGATAGAGALIGGPKGAATGATVGLFGGSILGSVDELYQGLIAEGIPPQQAGQIAISFGSAIGAGEALALGPVLKRIMGNQVSDAVVDRIAARIVGGRAGGVRQTAALGAGGEMAGETARQGVIAAATGDLDLAERATRVAESGIVGGIAGGGVGAGLRVTGRAGPAPGATPPSTEQEAAALEVLRQGTRPGETPIEGAQQPAPTPPPAEAGPPRPAPLTLPDRPEPLATREEAEAFLAANTDRFTPPTPLTTPSAIIGFANDARIADWEATTQRTRRQAITEFFPRAPDTTQIAASESFSNLAEAANRGYLKLNSFTPNSVARAALLSRDIDPGRVTPDEVKATTAQLEALAATGVIRRNTAEATTKKGKKVIKREATYSVNYGTPAQAQPAPAAAPTTEAPAATAPVSPPAEGAPVPQTAPAPPPPQAPTADPAYTLRPVTSLQRAEYYESLARRAEGMGRTDLAALFREGAADARQSAADSALFNGPPRRPSRPAPEPTAAPAPAAPPVPVELDPLRNNRPAGLRDTDGWKLHIGTAGMSPQQVSRLIGELRKTGQQAKTDRNSGQTGKDITVYVGSRADAERVARQLSPFTTGRIYGDAANDDIELAPGVGARFDVAGDRDFHQYGRGGVPILRDLIEFGKPFSDEAIRRSEATLAQRYGEFFTGRPAPAAPVTPRATPAAQPTAAPAPDAEQFTFKTAKGSSYTGFGDGSTTRVKAARPEHPGDSGPKPRSTRTIYVTPDVARALAVPADTNWRFVVGDGTVSLITQRPDGQWGVSPSQRELPFQTQPAVGLNPLEFWRPETIQGREAYRSFHPGNSITELTRTAPAQPTARTTVEVNGVRRETTPETVQQTVNEMRAARPAAAPAAAPPPVPPGPPPQMTDAEKKQANDPINEPVIGSVLNFFASPVLTLTKLSPAFANVRNAFMRFSSVENFYKDRASTGHRSLQNLSDESAKKVGLALDRARRTKQEVNEADFTAEEMQAIRDVRANMNFIYDAAIDGVARKYFNPDLAKDPADRARLQAFQDNYTGQFLSNIPDAALEAASPEGAKLVRKYKASRDPLYFPQRTDGTHFVAVREVGKKDIVALYAYTPLNTFQKRRGFEDPEALAIRKLREEFPNSSTHSVMTSGVRFEYDERAKSLKDNADFINKYLERLRDVSGKEGKRILNQMGAEIDKATIDSLFKPYKGILRAVTPENAVEYVRNYLPAYYLTAGRLNARLLTKPDFDQAFKPLRPENRQLFEGVLDYATSPSEAYSTARAFTFFQYLGFALDTAAVSALQIPQAVAPRFGRDAGVAKGTEYLTKAMNDALLDKAILSVLSADQAYAKTLANKPGRRDEIQAIKRAIQRGTLRPSSVVQMQGAVSPADLRRAGIADKDAAKFADGVNKVVDLAGRPLAAIEEFGRVSTFMAAYRLARDNPSVIEASNRYDNTNYKTAEDYAAGVVFDTWYAGSKMDDPGFIRQFPVLNVATQFMRPVFKFTETIIRDAIKTIKSLASRDLTMARMGAISLVGSLGPLVLLGGLWALPFADLSRELLERLLKTVFDNPLDLRLELDRAMGGGFLGEAANFGLPSASNWVNLSKRIAVDPIPSDTLFDWSTLALFGPAGDLLSRIQPTYEHWKRGEYWEAAASFPLTPRVIGNGIKGAQLAVEEEQFTRAGTRFITPELLERVDSRLDVPAAARQALGFPAPELATERELWRRAQVIDKATDSVNKSITMELSRIFLRALEAQRQGDMTEHARQVEALRRRIQEISAEQAAKPPHLRGNINMNAVRDRARQDLLGRSAPEVLIEETRRQARPALPPIIEEMRWRDRQ